MANVVVFGATSAIAAEMAVLYAQRGDRLFLVGRDDGKLAALRQRVGAPVVGARAVDLTDLASHPRLVEEAAAALGGIDVCVVAHGWLGDQLESERTFEHAEAVLTTNFTSVVSLVIPLANHLEARALGGHAGQAREPGRLVVLSSVAGDRGRPRNYTYGAAKGALNVYLQGVRSRLFPCGVSVTTVHLGPVHTPMTVDHPKNPLFAQPDAAARDIVAAGDRRRGDVYVPSFWRPIMGVVRTLPERIFQRVGFLAGR